MPQRNLTKAELRLLASAERKARVRQRQLDGHIARYAYWGARAASDYSREQFSAALVNVRYWSTMYALARADAEMLRIRLGCRPSNGRRR